MFLLSHLDNLPESSYLHGVAVHLVTAAILLDDIVTVCLRVWLPMIYAQHVSRLGETKPASVDII